MSEAIIYPRAGLETYAVAAEGIAVEANASALCWSAVIGGAVVATAVTFVLVALGSGLGLAWLSPITGDNPSMTTFTVTAAVWLIIVQWLAAASGGFLTGRLRTKWVGTHTHEVFFRDTAHGFLVWAASTLLIVALVAATSSAILGSGVRAAATAAGGAAQGMTAGGGYDVDSLFRTAQSDTAPATAAQARAEVGRIMAHGLVVGDVPPADRAYAAQIVATRAGIPPADARKRVDDLVAQDKASTAKAVLAADAARKAASRASIFLAVSMLIGAFVACAAAALGGSMRDDHA